MRRPKLPFSLPLAVALVVMSASHAFAQETPQETAVLDAVTRWKLINTALFVIGFGWLLWKFAPAFFQARSSDIQKAIQNATGLKIQADFRHSEIDRKMAGLADEIRKMREQAALELAREHERFRVQAQFEIEHIHQNVAAEIDAFRQEGIQQVRRRAAELALDRTAKQLAERFQSGEPQGLLHEFIHLVEHGRN